MNIVLLGPQGSGKGTQARLLSEKMGFFHMESGSLLRNLAKTNKRINEIINVKGELVPDEETLNYICKKLEKENPQKYDQVVFDGYPRSINQYKLLKQKLLSESYSIDLVFYIHISERETVRRLSARRIDKVSGEIYNLITNPPSKNINKSNLIQREDDQPEIIKKRLAVFYEQTKPMIKQIKRDGILVKINGEQPVDKIYKEIKQRIDEKKAA